MCHSPGEQQEILCLCCSRHLVLPGPSRCAQSTSQMAAAHPWAPPYGLGHLPALSRSRRGHVTGNLRTLAPQTETRPHLIECRAKRQLLPQTACDPMCSQGSGQYLLPVMISSNWTIENRQVYQHPLKLMGNKQNK